MPPEPELNEHFRQALLETIPCAVFIVDRDKRIIFWNRSAEMLTGYSAAEVLGSACEVLELSLCTEHCRQSVGDLCPLGRAGTGLDVECEIRRRDGSVVPIVRKARPVLDDRGERIGAIEALIDVSLIKEARAAVRTLTREIARTGRYEELVGSSEPMQKLYEIMELVADTDAGVMIEGETGTGKELVARIIHRRSRRAGKVFLAVNCGALPETLLEAELFGHVRGAFTGAVGDRAGRFEEASGGTLFLDEVSELALNSQVKLLRVLQEREVTRVGESRPRPVDVRIIAAANRDLARLVRDGKFREDLYYRLRVVGLVVPPLRDRREDIPALVAHFLERLNRTYERAVRGCSAEVMDVLLGYPWPGNVRQLEHVLEHAVVVSPPGETLIGRGSLPAELLSTPLPAAAPAGPAAADGPPSRRRKRSAEEERAEVLAVLSRAGGNKAQAARDLGLTRAGLYKRLSRLGIEG